jgi:hypothetical protein
VDPDLQLFELLNPGPDSGVQLINCKLKPFFSTKKKHWFFPVKTTKIEDEFAYFWQNAAF